MSGRKLPNGPPPPGTRKPDPPPAPPAPPSPMSARSVQERIARAERLKVATAVLSGIAANPADAYVRGEVAAKKAVELADLLIAEVDGTAGPGVDGRED